jgi:hypothetical protein
MLRTSWDLLALLVGFVESTEVIAYYQTAVSQGKLEKGFGC